MSAPGTRIGSKEINNKTYDVNASTSGNFFIVEDDAVVGQGDTLDKAVTDARAQLNRTKIKVRVPFYSFTGEQGIATGIHGRSNNPMVKMENGSGKTEQWTGTDFVLRGDMPDEVLERFMKWRERQKLASEKVREITNEYGVHLTRAVREEIKATEERQTHKGGDKSDRPAAKPAPLRLAPIGKHLRKL